MQNHALERIRQRGLQINQVRECLLNPDKVLKSNNVKKAAKKLNNKALVVVYKALNKEA
ncbi:DUF4258 domain-containing protein [Candidatus Bathyarchaeota archaeon]|nr:MAG: DUF4258 domain-containing protein [Candidatus Bathyarchaeota archaeon]